MQKIRVSQETLVEIERVRIEGESFDSALKRILGILPTKEQLYEDYPSEMVDRVESLLGDVRQEFDLHEIIEVREQWLCIDLVTSTNQMVMVQARSEAESNSIQLFVREDLQGGLISVGSISDGTGDERASLIRNRLHEEVGRAVEQWAPSG